MAFNWADQEIQKPEFTSMEEVFKSMQNVREMRRKRAIEDAIKAGVGPDGQFSGGRVRQSLTDAGFGEDADAVVRDIAMKRQGDVKSTAELGVMLKGLVDNGIINESRARELFDNMTLQEPIGTSTTSTVTTASTPATGTGQIDETQLMQQAQSFVDEAPKSQPSGSPGSGTRQSVVGATEAIIRPEGDLQPTGGVASLTDIGPQTRTRRTEAQAVPDYASDLINWDAKPFGSFSPVSGDKGSSFAYMMPTDPTDLQQTLAAAQRLGYDISNPSDASMNEQITARAESIAGPVPVYIPPTNFEDIYKAQADYMQKLRDRAAKVSEAKQAQVDALSKERSGKFSEGVTKEQQRLAREADARAKKAQEYDLAGQNSRLFFEIPGKEFVVEAGKIAKAVPDVVLSTNSFADALGAAIAVSNARGTVNADLVITELQSMGAKPSTSWAEFRLLLAQGGDWQSDSYRWLKSQGLGEGQGANPAWVKKTIDGMNKDLVSRGAFPYDYNGKKMNPKYIDETVDVEPPTGTAKRTAEQDLADMRKRGEDKTKKTKSAGATSRASKKGR